MSIDLYDQPHKVYRGVNLISRALPFGRLWYAETNAIGNAVDYAKFRSRSHNAVIRVWQRDPFHPSMQFKPLFRNVSPNGK
jgi:hypothetical protein